MNRQPFRAEETLPSIPTIRKLELGFLRLVLGVPTAILYPLLKVSGWTSDSLAETLATRILKDVGPDAASESLVYGIKVIHWTTAKQFTCEWVACLIMQALLAVLLSREVSTFFPVVFYVLLPLMCLWCAYHSPVFPILGAVFSMVGFMPSIVTALSLGDRHLPLLLFSGWAIVWAILSAVVAMLRRHSGYRIAETYPA